MAGVSSVARLTRLTSPFHVPRIMAASSQNQVGSFRLIMIGPVNSEIEFFSFDIASMY